MSGFIKLNRKFFTNPLWTEDRIYSRSEAWLDLISSAGIEDFKLHIKGKDIEVSRGEVAASRRYLEKRWNWGSTKTGNFLNYLKGQGMISTRQTSGQTIIKLVKFSDYNDSQTSQQTRGKPEANQIEERKEVFKKQVFKYSDQFEKSILEDFFEYWSEHGERARKMRFEKQPSWNLKGRLSTWMKNEKKWNKKDEPTINRQTAETIQRNSQGW